MSISIFDLFSIGIGPSSSHTVGPMRAARKFLLEAGDLSQYNSIKIELFGSLALTGKGHGTDWSIIFGLEGQTPEDIDPASIKDHLEQIYSTKKISLLGQKEIPFDEKTDLIFCTDKMLPFHSNAMRFTMGGFQKIYYSVGGGFVIEEGKQEELFSEVPYSFKSADELLAACRKNNMSIEELMLENEKTWRDEETIRQRLLVIWQVMRDCIDRGLHTSGILPGVLKLERRAPELFRQLTQVDGGSDPSEIMDWLSLYAIAIGEENAAGGRIVTAPTNGAAGIIPSVLHYYWNFTDNPSEDGIVKFLLVAGAVGILYKLGASISGAEVGCQGEVGVACSMAAAGLAAVMGGTRRQIENAAEIGMEHNLGLTCDPVAGLVQIPCIERNAMGAIKAVNAARLALRGDGSHKISLDQVIATMRQTGADMSSIYKETSKGGLAANIILC